MKPNEGKVEDGQWNVSSSSGTGRAVDYKRSLPNLWYKAANCKKIQFPLMRAYVGVDIWVSS